MIYAYTNRNIKQNATQKLRIIATSAKTLPELDILLDGNKLFT